MQEKLTYALVACRRVSNPETHISGTRSHTTVEYMTGFLAESVTSSQETCFNTLGQMKTDLAQMIIIAGQKKINNIQRL